MTNTPKPSLNLPFFLAAKTAPNGADQTSDTPTTAQVVIDWSSRNQIETQCLLQTPTKQTLLWSSPRLIPTAGGTLLTWQKDAGRLAVSQFLTVHVADIPGQTWQHRFAKPVSDIAYDSDDSLLVLSGTTLYRCDISGSSDVEDKHTAIFHESVEAIHSVGQQTYIARQKPQGAETILEVLTTTGSAVFELDVSGREIGEVLLKGDEDTLFVSICDKPNQGYCRLSIVRLHDQQVFIDDEVAVGIAELKIDWHPLDNRSIAVNAELDSICGLWVIEQQQQRQRLTDPSLEVDVVRWSPDGMSVIVGGKDTAGVGARRSQCLSRDGGVYWDRPQAVCDATWLNAQSYLLVYEAMQSTPCWRQKQESLTDFRLTAPGPFNTPAAVDDLLVFDTKQSNADFGILYVMGPHRFFALGPQRLFYHYSIRSQLEAIAPQRSLVLGLNGAGSLGAGKQRRTASTSYCDAAVQDIKTGVEHLRRHCTGPVILVAASLGCLPSLRFLAENTIDGAVLLNPVYTADIPPLRPWHYLYGEHNTLDAAFDQYAPAIGTPMLLVHGQRDPISPSQHSSDFLMSLPEDVYCDYVTVPDEGHIFQSDPGWRMLLDSLREFIDNIVRRQLPDQEA